MDCMKCNSRNKKEIEHSEQWTMIKFIGKRKNLYRALFIVSAVLNLLAMILLVVRW